MSKPSLYAVSGEDDYLVEEKAREILAERIAPDQRDFGLEIVDGQADIVDEAVRALRQCREALQTLGFFGNEKLVWLRNATFFQDKGPGQSATTRAAVQALAEMIKSGLPDGQALLVTAPKMDKRLAFYKACKAAGAEFHEYRISEKAHEAHQQADRRLQHVLRKAELVMKEEVRTAFLEKVGPETRQIVNEIEKMSAYLGERRTVTLQDLAEITSTSRDSVAWDWLDVVGERDLEGALVLLRQLLFQGKKTSAVGLVMFLAGRIQDWILYRQALDRGWLQPYRGGMMKWGRLPPVVAQTLDGFRKNPTTAHPFRVGILARQAKRFSMPELLAAYREVMAAYEQLVSGRAPDALVLELLLIQTLAPQKKRLTT